MTLSHISARLGPCTTLAIPLRPLIYIKNYVERWSQQPETFFCGPFTRLVSSLVPRNSWRLLLHDTGSLESLSFPRSSRSWIIEFPCLAFISTRKSRLREQFEMIFHKNPKVKHNFSLRVSGKIKNFLFRLSTKVLEQILTRFCVHSRKWWSGKAGIRVEMKTRSSSRSSLIINTSFFCGMSSSDLPRSVTSTECK